MRLDVSEKTDEKGEVGEPIGTALRLACDDDSCCEPPTIECNPPSDDAPSRWVFVRGSKSERALKYWLFVP